MGIKVVKVQKGPKKTQEQEDQERIQKAKDSYASKVPEDKDGSYDANRVKTAYSETTNRNPNAHGSAGKPNAQKIRKAGSTTHTIAGEPVKKKKTVTVAKYKSGTSGIKMKKKGC